jgi:hypothetical protein
MNGRVGQQHRSGAALIIAIVVLAALLMLGLPFLFTQSASLSGTRSYAHSELANIGQDSAQSMGVAAGAGAVTHHWKENRLDDWTDLFLSLEGQQPGSGLRKVRGFVNRIEFDTRNHTFALPGDTFLNGITDVAQRDAQLRRYPTVVGLTIEDESGKLNPNYLDAIAWSRLLEAVGISDWPDITPSATPPPSPTMDRGRNQLARALASLRYHLAGGRITALDQLLLADSSAQRNPRRGLTRSELELLRPYLSLSVPSQARGSMIDLGTVIGRSGRKISIDSAQPAGLIAFPITPLVIGVGTTVLAEDADGIIHAFPVTGDDVVVVPQIGDPLAIDAPPLVNLHQAEPPVRKTLAINDLDLPPTGPSVAANPSATPPVPARLLAPALISELNSNAYSSSKPLDALGRARSWFELTSPLSIPETLGSADVVEVYNDASPRVILNILDAKDEKTVPATAPYVEIAGDSLDHFPDSGYAKLVGTLAAVSLPEVRQQDFEYVRYESFGALPQSVGSARANSRVGVRITRQQPPSIVAKSFKLNGLKFIAISPREQHPVGIASQGVISIASAATVTDPAGNQTAQQQHRVIAQTLPQEAPLEARWNKQAALHALLAQRHGSLMATFPRPYPRRSDVLPQDAPNVSAPTDVPPNKPYVPPVTMTDLDSSVGIRPAVMRTLLSSPYIDRSWMLSFSGDGGRDPMKQLNGGEVPNTDHYATGKNITPEGLRLDANVVLAYPNLSTGFLPDNYIPPVVGNANTGVVSSIQGRQFSLWVRPDKTWGPSVALLDMRIPEGNLSESLTGVLQPNKLFDERTLITSDVNVGNRFTLRYDSALKQVILELNPGTVPHAADYGPRIPRETYGTIGSKGKIPLKDNIWPAVNPECLGSDESNPKANPMASASPPATSIQHRYALGSAFVPGTWHLIQVAFSSNQPGGMSIIVDGLVGRDVSSQPDDTTAMSIPGDHMTQPNLVLLTPLGDDPKVKDFGAQALYVPIIALDALAFDAGGNRLTKRDAVQYLLPKRGIVRIGNEYISYQSIDANGALIDCVRARRQRTDAQVSYNPMNQPVVNWNTAHKLEVHAIGAPVLPGGFAIGNQGGAWWRGGCSLAQVMPDGDPLHEFQVHANVRATDLLATPYPAGSLTLPLVGTVSNLADFPMRGYVMVNNDIRLIYYDNGDQLPSVTGELAGINHWGTTGWQSGTPFAISGDGTSSVVLVSAELKGDPTKARAYNLVTPDSKGPFAPQLAASSGLIQLYDARSADDAPNGGRVEWLAYTSIDSRTDYPTSAGTRVSYLMNITMEITKVPAVPPATLETDIVSYRPGFWFHLLDPSPAGDRNGTRGRERTAFAPTDLTTYSPADHRFPIDTRVIPVQTSVEIGYLLEAGDVVTLAPVVMGTAASGQRPLQMCVRYSADDGFSETTIANSWPWNVSNKHFAFTEAIPDTWNLNESNFHVLCWPCWTPEVDLSPIQSPEWQLQRLGWVLPWGNAYAPDFLPNDLNRTITLLTKDEFPVSGYDGMIDAVHSGTQPGWPQGTQVQANIVPPSNNIWMDDQLMTTPLLIRTDQPIFNDAYGIVEIGGETFAYKTDSQQDKLDFGNPKAVPPIPQIDGVLNNQAWLIGRSLLGSTRRAHQGPELVLHLPIGPVAEIATPIGKDFIGSVSLEPGDIFNAPAVLLTSRNGDQQELTVLPNNYTASWLRGMYNTTPIPWVDRGSAAAVPNLAPLAIGWWPRYPSGFPKDLSTRAADVFAAFLRCRSYAWAGFPLRFHDTQFDGKNLIAEVTALSTGGGLFDLQALALDGRMDWSAASMNSLLNGNNSPSATPVNMSSAFNSASFKVLADETLNSRLTNASGAVRTVDGAELRIIWTYHDAPLPATASPVEWLQDAARSGNSAPMIGPVYLRARAPNKVISVER